jgi:hypothetical protein
VPLVSLVPMPLLPCFVVAFVAFAPSTDAPASPANGDGARAPKESTPAASEPSDRSREVEFEPGVMIWLRGQARHEPSFGGGSPDEIDALSRIRLQAGLRWRALTVFAQAQDHRAWGSRTELGTGAVGFQQGWVEVAGGKTGEVSGSIRAGRQEISWGRDRLVGTLPWAPQGRTFDAIRMQGRVRWLELELLYTMMERPRTFTATDESVDPPEELRIHTLGAHYGGGKLSAKPHRAFGLELIGLFDRGDASPQALDRDRIIGNVGGRAWGEPVDGVTYDVEVHGQFGRVGALTHRAWAGAGTLRAFAPTGDVAPGVQVGYAIASGHACTGASATVCAPTQSRDFFNFYPTNHIHYGILDQFGWSNMRDLEGGVFVRKGRTIEAGAVYHFFQMQQRGGTWRDAVGNPVGIGWDPNQTAATLGHEIDVLVTARLWAPLWLQPGYGVFLPAAAGTRIAGPDPQHFVFLWVVAEIPAP